MKKKKYPKSFRKFVRREKAKLRRQFSGFKEKRKLIKMIYKKL